MARNRWIYKADGRVIDCSQEQVEVESTGRVTIMPDLPDFVSPIDGKTYSGRAGMREHCQKHNVVPTADLKGLPPKLAHQAPTFTKEQSRERTNQIARIVDNHWRN